MTLNQVRKFALSLPETMEIPHFERTSFRVRGKIFVTGRPLDEYIHVFVGEQHREPVLAMYPDFVEKLFWGGKVVGLRLTISNTPVSLIKDLIRLAWEAKAPKSLNKNSKTARK